MASSPLFNLANHVSDSTCDKIHGRSNAQMCLKKIIDIISSISKGPSLNPQFDGLEKEENASGEKSRALFPGKRGFDLDLNLWVGPPLDAEESEFQTQNRGYSVSSAIGEANGNVCRIVIDCNSSAVCGDASTVEKCSEGKCDAKEAGNSSGDFSVTEENVVDEEEGEVKGETREFSDIANLQVGCTEIDDMRDWEETEDVEQSEIKAAEEEEEKKRQQKQELEVSDGEGRRLSWRRECRSEGYLGLLIEAARLISGNFEDDEAEPEKTIGLRHEAVGEAHRGTEAETGTNEESERSQCWMLNYYREFEDISPVVRSKRGRNQVLPFRYRDSVLEPWKRLSRQRSMRVSSKPRPR